MWFIDKLNMYQDHENELPTIGSEGSFSSSLRIRCNGTRVCIEGNPSRWNRAENLFGFNSIEYCISIYNHILITLGLPPFTKATIAEYRQGEDGKKVELITNGSVLTHIDVTRNLSVRAGCEVSYLRGLSTLTIGKSQKPYLYANNMTVDWYKGSTVRYTKAYVKSHDLNDHKKKRLKEATEIEKAQYESVIKFCDVVGFPWRK